MKKKDAGIMAVALLMVIATQVNAAMVSHWGFEEAEDTTTAYDDVGGYTAYGQDGADMDTYSVIGSGSSKYDSLSRFSVTGSATAGHALDIRGNITISAWVFSSDISTTHKGIYTRGDLYEGHSLAIKDDDDNKLWTYAHESPSGTTSLTGGTSLSFPVEFRHVVKTFDGATTRLYVNGAQVASEANTRLADGGGRVTAFGCMGDTSANYPLYGRIDDMAVWNNDLEAGEVRAIYNLGVGLSSALNYNAKDAQDLFDVFDAGSGSVEIRRTTWTYATGLTTGGNDGDLNDLGGGSYELVMDAANGYGLLGVSTPGLVSHWGFEEAEGTTVAYDDVSGHTAFGVGANAVMYTNAVIGARCSQYASSRFSVTGSNADGHDLDIRSNITVSAWVKSWDTSSTHKGIYTRGDTYEGHSLAIKEDDDNRLWTFAHTSPSGGTQLTGGDNISTTGEVTKVWHHVAKTFDGATTRLYVDGAQIASTANTRVADGGGRVTAFGCKSDSTDYPLQGYLDDIAVWNKDLDAGEVRAINNLGVGLSSALNYNAKDAEALFDTFDAGSGSYVEINGKTWSYSESMESTAVNDGDLFDIGGGNFELVMDAASGYGLTTQEPQPVIASFEHVPGGDVYRMTVSFHPSVSPSSYSPVKSTDLPGGVWDGSITHSTNGVGGWIDTNMSYSATVGSSNVIYLQSTDAKAFYGLE